MWLRHAAQALADIIPYARSRTIKNQNEVAPEVPAPSCKSSSQIMIIGQFSSGVGSMSKDELLRGPWFWLWILGY